MESETKRVLKSIELVLLILTAGVSIIVSVLDLTGILDSAPDVARRIPSLVLLSVGFIASYLIVERRGKLEDIYSSLARHNYEMLRAIGIEVEEYSTSADWAMSLSNRIRKAKRVNDVSWGDEESLQHRWSQSDRTAHNKCDAAVAEIIRKHDVIWREVCVFSENRFKRKSKDILDPQAIGYSIAYLEPSTKKAIPRIGGFMTIDAETQEGELFIANTESTMWLRIRHPAIVSYFAHYFDNLWNAASILKSGPHLNQELFKKLDSIYGNQ
jgi:hypothetical protein